MKYRARPLGSGKCSLPYPKMTDDDHASVIRRGRERQHAIMKDERVWLFPPVNLSRIADDDFEGVPSNRTLASFFGETACFSAVYPHDVVDHWGCRYAYGGTGDTHGFWAIALPGGRAEDHPSAPLFRAAERLMAWFRTRDPNYKFHETIHFLGPLTSIEMLVVSDDVRDCWSLSPTALCLQHGHVYLDPNHPDGATFLGEPRRGQLTN